MRTVNSLTAVRLGKGGPGFAGAAGNTMEIEWKYELPDEGTGLRILEETAALRGAGPEEVRYMHSLYYDTEDRRLRRAGASLRLRYEGAEPEGAGRDGFVCCLKLRGDSSGGSGGLWVRQEFEAPARGLWDGLSKLHKAGAPTDILEEMAPGALQPVGEVRFIRHLRSLELPEGAVCELSVDAGEFCGPSGHQPFCELELELKSGELPPVQALAGSIAARWGLSAQPRSKAQRAAELYAR